MDDEHGTVDPEPSEAPATTYGDPTTVGYLLNPDTKPSDVAQYIRDEWSAQDDRYARRIKENEVNKRRRGGEGNLWVEKDPNQNSFRIYESHGTQKYNQFYQKAGRLALRTVAVTHLDPPIPEAIPQTGESDDRDAAEFATRVLKNETSETGCNQLEAHKQGFDWASNGGSAYVWYFTDPYGDRQPIEVEAAPHHQTAEDAQAMLGPDGSPWGGEKMPRYVLPNGALSPTPKGAAMRWVPKVTREVVEFPHVRLQPANATDIWDATGLIYGAYHPWKTAKAWFAEGLANVSEEERNEAIAYRLPGADFLLPKRNGKKYDPKPKDGHEDDGLVLLMMKWCQMGPDYPDGAYIVVVGKELVAHRDTWVIDTDRGIERRDIPFTQIQQWRGDKDNPTGIGMMDFLGPSNENRGEVVGQVLDMLDKALNPLTLLPLGSTLQDEDLDNPLDSVVRFQPGFKPERFEGPKIPAEAFKLIDMIGQDMNDATGMGQASAEGMEAPNVNSGRHALAIQAQEKAALADLNQNINRAYKRAWRIILQCIKADYSSPQLLKYVDRDGGYKVRRWMGSDLGSVRDVEIQRGTGTLFTPAQKAEYVTQYAQLAGIPPEDIRELLATGYAPYITLQDDEHLQRVRRQISQWEQGPPADWTPPPPPEPPPMVGVDPMGQPVMGPPAPPVPYDPVFGADQRPVDMAPVAAQTRIREIGNVMAGTKYGAMPPEWREALNQEFARMQQALAPPPPPMPGGKPGGPPEPKAQLSPAEQAAGGAGL